MTVIAGAPACAGKVTVSRYSVCGLVICEVFHLPLRATEGLMHSLIALLGVELEVPDYTAPSANGRHLGRQANALIPPRSTAVAWPPQANGQSHPQTTILEYRQQHGDKAWKIYSNYHGRSLAETAMFRFKTLFGERLSNRCFDTQATQAYARPEIFSPSFHLHDKAASINWKQYLELAKVE